MDIQVLSPGPLPRLSVHPRPRTKGLTQRTVQTRNIIQKAVHSTCGKLGPLAHGLWGRPDTQRANCSLRRGRSSGTPAASHERTLIATATRRSPSRIRTNGSTAACASGSYAGGWTWTTVAPGRAHRFYAMTAARAGRYGGWRRQVPPRSSGLPGRRGLGGKKSSRDLGWATMRIGCTGFRGVMANGGGFLTQKPWSRIRRILL